MLSRSQGLALALSRVLKIWRLLPLACRCLCGCPWQHHTLCVITGYLVVCIVVARKMEDLLWILAAESGFREDLSLLPLRRPL
eukprot:1800079-Rhodomonas_salina.1